MSNCKNIQSNNINKNNVDFQYFKRSRLLFDFKYYIIRTFGFETWNSLLENYEFFNLYNNLGIQYGDSIFHDILDLLSDHLNEEIKTIICCFTEFRSTIEFLSYEEVRNLVFI